MHIHVVSPSGEAKFWLEPELKIANNYRYNSKELKEVKLIIEENYDRLVEAWRQHFDH